MERKLLPVFVSIIAVMFFIAPPAARAHLPYLVGESVSNKINNPEISKAYYGWLSGRPAAYSISSPAPFLLYVNLLSPRIESGKMDYSADIFKDGQLFARIAAENSIWLITYEPFANDYYAKGPEYEAAMPPGDYTIEVSNSGNSGNYVLAVGKTEDFSFGEFLRTVAVLPKVKEQFFGKNPWEAFNNFIGLALLVLIVLSGIAFYITGSIIRRRRLKNRLDAEYGKYKNHRPAR